MSELVKVCSGCKRALPAAAFSSNGARGDGLANECGECASARKAKTWSDDREALRAYSKAYYEANKHIRQAYYQENKERIAQYYRDNRPAINARRRDSRYGLPPGGWLALLERQERKCYLCGQLLPEDLSKAATDHNRNCCPGNKSCGKCVRGIACMPCNSVIGFARDDPDLLVTIAASLRAAQRVLRLGPEAQALNQELISND